MQLTAHFTTEEFRCRDGTAYPTKWINARLRLLCGSLEIIRGACGDRMLTVTSGYRTSTYNRRIGGARTSQHVEGRAADIVIKGLAAPEVHMIIQVLIRSGRLAITGLGAYPTFTHVDIRPSTRLASWGGRRVVTG